MADGRVIAHLAGFLSVELGSFFKEPLVNGNFAYVVQITSRTQRCYVRRIHAHRFADGLGVAANAQRVAVNVDVLDVDGGGECLRASESDLLGRSDPLDLPF